MQTYNHERYISQALVSILSQNINVSYEIIIVDDASTDNTPNILKQYKRKYPDLIRLYLRKVNSCHPTRVGYFLLSRAKGKYCAFIDGDDYWLDDHKIQKQYDFLRSNPEFSACTTNVKIVDENGNENVGAFFNYYRKEDHIFTLEDFRRRRTAGMAASFFSRNYFVQKDISIIYKASKYMGDQILYMLCVLEGDIYQFDETMAAYRCVSNSGDNNFESIHKDNIYKDINIFEYYIKLETYIKQYYNTSFNYNSLVMKSRIMYLADKYTLQVFIKAIWQSPNREKYLRYYLASRYLLSSRGALNEQRIHLKYSWADFRKEKKPIIIFGAGNMAAEYLDRYAWNNNVLFLVDNSSEKQNKSFKGYLVKSPAEIVNYKDKAIVLITNQQHEEEIEDQLFSMGISPVYRYCSMQSQRVRNVIARKLLKVGDEE